MRKQPDNSNPAAILPSVGEMLGQAPVRDLIALVGRARTTDLIRSIISDARERIADSDEGKPQMATGPDRDVVREQLIDRIVALGRAEVNAGVRRVINATGVAIHTNLGRSPLSNGALAAIAAASGYSTIEYDVAVGKRGTRGPRATSLLRQLTGADDALAVNNCAAAAMLVLSVFARNREVIVSRGELVEIGGDFRIPDILTRSGAVLREVGTTNRTHLRDYEAAINDRTAMILKVHPSNFRISGFTKAPTAIELSELAKKAGVLFYEDAGSGALIDLTAAGVTGEPVIPDVVAAGADLVSFSGDKLFGGPQCGLIVGRGELIGELRKDPFYRALRLDKTITAALEATLAAYARGTAIEEIPVLKMLFVSEAEIASRSEKFVNNLNSLTGEIFAPAISKGNSAVGGGAGPDVNLSTTIIALTHAGMSDAELESRLRLADPPIITRIADGRVMIDLRTVRESEEDEIISALRQIAPAGAGSAASAREV